MGHLFSPNRMAIRHLNIPPRTSSETLIVAGPTSERCQSYDCKIQTHLRFHTLQTTDPTTSRSIHNYERMAKITKLINHRADSFLRGLQLHKYLRNSMPSTQCVFYYHVHKGRPATCFYFEPH